MSSKKDDSTSILKKDLRTLRAVEKVLKNIKEGYRNLLDKDVDIVALDDALRDFEFSEKLGMDISDQIESVNRRLEELENEKSTLMNLLKFYDDIDNAYSSVTKKIPIHDINFWLRGLRFGQLLSRSYPEIEEDVKTEIERIKQEIDLIKTQEETVDLGALDRLLFIKWPNFVEDETEGLWGEEIVQEVKKTILFFISDFKISCLDEEEPFYVVTGSGIYYTEFNTEKRANIVDLCPIHALIVPTTSWERTQLNDALIKTDQSSEIIMNESLISIPISTFTVPIDRQNRISRMYLRKMFNKNVVPDFYKAMKAFQDLEQNEEAQVLYALSALKTHFFNVLLADGVSEAPNVFPGLRGSSKELKRFIKDLNSQHVRNNLLKRSRRIFDDYKTLAYPLITRWIDKEIEEAEVADKTVEKNQEEKEEPIPDQEEEPKEVENEAIPVEVDVEELAEEFAMLAGTEEVENSLDETKEDTGEPKTKTDGEHDLMLISGIGKSMKEKLIESGVNSIEELLEVDVKELSEKMGKRVTKKKINEWIKAGKEILDG
ncbi:MAG: helix-hairpin-helix domain-containing protein [Candidatus Hermodarchaeota archaeon]